MSVNVVRGGEGGGRGQRRGGGDYCWYCVFVCWNKPESFDLEARSSWEKINSLKN